MSLGGKRAPYGALFFSECFLSLLVFDELDFGDFVEGIFRSQSLDDGVSSVSVSWRGEDLTTRSENRRVFARELVVDPKERKDFGHLR